MSSTMDAQIEQKQDGRDMKIGVATGKLGFYGITPIVQRTGGAQATSLVGTASSTAVNTDLKAAILEIMNTLAALNLWKGSA